MQLRKQQSQVSSHFSSNSQNLVDYEINKIYLFVNSKSGDGQGKQYLTLSQKHLIYKFQFSLQTHVYVVDMLNVQKRNKALQNIRQTMLNQQPKNKTYIKIIICGGDGTIMWVLQQCLNHQIDLQNVIFGILPIGTGNDFSRSLGWGSHPLKFSNTNLLQLNNIVKKWVSSKTSFYDIWDVQLTTYQSGCFYQVHNQNQEKKEIKQLKKSFSNYCGMGLDARVVYTVQQNRTKFAFFNKVVYGCVGMCNFFRSMKKFDETVQQFSESQSQSQSQMSQKQKSQGQISLRKMSYTLTDKLLSQNKTVNSKDKSQNQSSLQQSERQNKIINQFIDNQNQKKIKKQNQHQNSQQMQNTFKQININLDQLSQSKQKKFLNKDNIWNSIQMKSGYRGIVALNCPSYMAGLRHVWETSKIGRKKSNKSQQKKFKKQTYNDGLLQFVGYKSELGLALQRVMRSGAKMTQGQGPFQILMKQPTQKNPAYESFIQIDGQSLKVVNLKSIKIYKSKKFPHSRIKVMVNSR